MRYISRLENKIYAWSYRKYKIPFRLKYFIQRAKRGYSDADVWDISYYLTWVIQNSFKDLEEIALSIPSILKDGDGNIIYQYDFEEELQDPETYWKDAKEAYHKLLKDIYENIGCVEDIESLEEEYMYDEAMNKQLEALKLLIHNWNVFWD